MSRVLILAATTGYQTRSFGEAAERLGVELVFATDRCHLIDDPWQDQAIPIRFHDEDGSVAAILDAAKVRGIDGVLAVGDRPTVIAARVAQALGIPWHSAEAASVARHKQRMRERLRDAGLPVPWFFPVALPGAQAISHQPSAIDSDRPQPLSYPCVVKPMSLSGSRGVMRADGPASFATALERLRVLLRSPEVRAERNEAHETALIEGFIPGREYAVEALLQHGTLHVLAIFDKPEPLDGPFFEETIYVTPSSAPAAIQEQIVEAVAAAGRAVGLYHGPVHAECRVNEDGVFVLEAAARPIGGLCARALRFQSEIANRSAINQSATSNQSAINQSATSNRSAINQSATSNQSAINQSATSNQSAINQSATSNQSAINQSATNQSAINQSPTSNHSAINQSPTSNHSAINQSPISNRSAINQSAISNQSAIRNPQSAISLEELLLRHALGEASGQWRRESEASGVMMIPIPRRGIFRTMTGVDAAREVAGIDDIRITAKPDQLLVPLPEGASYLGFIFARAPRVAAVAQALRAAHSRLTVIIDPEFPVLTAAQIQYNLQHG